MNLGTEGMRIHGTHVRELLVQRPRCPAPALNMLAASLLLACAPFARAGDADAAQDATPAPSTAFTFQKTGDL